MPWLLRVIGAKQIGLLIMIQIINSYIWQISDYGFSTSAVRQVALYTNDRNKLAELISTITSWRLTVCIILGTLGCVVISYVSVLEYNLLLFLACFVQVFGQAISPAWLFLGLQKNFIFALFMVASRIACIFCILFVVKGSEDVSIAALFLSLPFVIAALCGWGYLFVRENISFKSFSTNELAMQLKEGQHFFIASLTTSLYAMSPPLIVGLMVGEVEAGIFGVIHRLFTTLTNMFQPFYQALYPRMSVMLKTPGKAKIFLKKLHLGMLCIMCVFTLAVWSIAPWLTELIVKSSSKGTITIFLLLTLLPLIISQNSITGTLTLVASGSHKAYRNAMVTAGVSGISICILFTWAFEAPGAALAAVFSEILITVLLINQSRGFFA